MASIGEIARTHTGLEHGQLVHLQRLVSSWSLLSDLSFSDLLLLAPTLDSIDGDRYVVLSQIRPTTAQTVYPQDWVGRVMTDVERPLVSHVLQTREIIEGEITPPVPAQRVRIMAVPVTYKGQVIAILTKEGAPSRTRLSGELESTYVGIFNRFARMIADGTFPYPDQDTDVEEAPRVGDGVLLVDAKGRVVYASPNAVSALHRVGIHTHAAGSRLSELGFEETIVRTALTSGLPVSEEVERGPDVVAAVRALPLLVSGVATGAVILMRDVSDLRRRDRLLLSKDATIREIHHRVKNNLQTISSLLRLHSRRLDSAEAKAALRESERRIQSIALVHETLSREAGEDIPFVEVVRPLARMVEEALVTPERQVKFVLSGDAGKLPSTLATNLAVVMNELLQNAVDHGYPPSLERGGQVDITLSVTGNDLTLTVADDGIGVPEDFNLKSNSGLGLSIVRTLVRTELEGKIWVRPRADKPGTEVMIKVPIRMEALAG